MIKKLLVPVGLLFLSMPLWSQEGTSSPYSFYGIGDERFKGTVEQRSIGGVGAFADSLHLNLLNPASFSRLRFTTFSIGANQNYNSFKSEEGNDSAQRTTIDYLAVGLPMGKFGVAFGLIPYSSVGYKIENTIISDEEERLRTFNGRGGVNRAFLGVGYQINKELSVGVEGNFNFGEIETANTTYVLGVQNGTREENESRISGFGLSLGLMYYKKIRENLTGFGSLNFKPQTSLTLENQRVIKTVFPSSAGELTVDEVKIDVADTKINMPSIFTLGFGLADMNKWMVSGEVSYRQSRAMGSRFDDIENVSYENSFRVGLGGFYIPNYKSFSNYLSRVTYRAGFRYENTGLVIQDQTINDFGMTFGLGLPVGGAISNLNIAVEAGQRGTTRQNLVQENYINVSIGLSVNDRWFVRRKYD